MNRHPVPIASCGCAAGGATRRRVVGITAMGLAAPLAMVTQPEVAVVSGDYLVEEDIEGVPVPLRVADLKPGKPLLAYPFDAKTGKRRDETRLSKILLILLPEAEMTPQTRARAAGGVLAYSAICTHQACDVKTWLSKEKVLACFCHASKFNLFDDGKVLGGPANRALPSVPLKLDGDQLVLAGTLSAEPGGSA